MRVEAHEIPDIFQDVPPEQADKVTIPGYSMAMGIQGEKIHLIVDGYDMAFVCDIVTGIEGVPRTNILETAKEYVELDILELVTGRWDPSEEAA